MASIFRYGCQRHYSVCWNWASFWSEFFPFKKCWLVGIKTFNRCACVWVSRGTAEHLFLKWPEIQLLKFIWDMGDMNPNPASPWLRPVSVFRKTSLKRCVFLPVWRRIFCWLNKFSVTTQYPEQKEQLAGKTPSSASAGACCVFDIWGFAVGLQTWSRGGAEPLCSVGPRSCSTAR